MIERFSSFPRALAERSRAERLAGVPTLLAHPDWTSPAPVVVWLHGRTASKELDPGRYLRWIRAGIAACAIDLPGHGERADPAMQTPARTPEVLEAVLPEIDAVLAELVAPRFAGVFDTARTGLGGMSAGGMATLRRLCDPHPFRAAAVDATTGDLGAYFARHAPAARIARLDPMSNLAGWRPIPLLAVHSRADAIVPFTSQAGFLERLSAHYRDRGADPEWIQVLAWDTTGAPQEHVGFGRFSNDAKNAQTGFWTRTLA